MSIRKTYPLVKPDVNPEIDVATGGEIPLPAVYPDPAVILEGWPGHRTQPGKMGLDPLENDFEAAHMAGVFIRYLFTGMPHAPSTLYLLLVPLLGLLLCAPFALALYSAWLGDPAPLAGWAYILPLALLGVAILVRFGLTLWPKRLP
jgi:hypothetical protein